MKEQLIAELRETEHFFNNSTSCLEEADSMFRPTEASLSVAGQVAHVARTIDWFVDAIQSPCGFDMKFAADWEESAGVTSLADAKRWFSRAMDNAVNVIGALDEQQLRAPLPDGPVMGGKPKLAVVGGIVDHTAHHRGALSVYSRLLGRTPAMPYLP